MDPQRQPFLSATSSYLPYALGMGLTLLSMLLFWQPQPVGAAAAALLTGVVLLSLLLELQFRSNPLRWLLPIEQSQNVYAVAPCQNSSSPAAGHDEDAPMGSIASSAASSAECPATVVVTAHLDTHRTPLLFSSPFWLNVFRWLLPVGLGAVAALLILFVVGIVVPAPALRLIALAPGLVVLGVFALMVQADLTPFSKGANDNASGVAVALWLAERLAETPLQRTRTILVFTGCEEVGGYGADAFFGARRATLGDARGSAAHIVIDQVASAHSNPAVVRGERFLRPAYSDPGLLALADRLIQQHPEWRAGSLSLSTGYGELSVGVKHGLRAIAFGTFTADGSSPHWHQASDVIGNIDETALDRTQQIVWALLQEIDFVEAAGDLTLRNTQPASGSQAV